MARDEKRETGNWGASATGNREQAGRRSSVFALYGRANMLQCRYKRMMLRGELEEEDEEGEELDYNVSVDVGAKLCDFVSMVGEVLRMRTGRSDGVAVRDYNYELRWYFGVSDFGNTTPSLVLASLLL